MVFISILIFFLMLSLLSNHFDEIICAVSSFVGGGVEVCDYNEND